MVHHVIYYCNTFNIVHRYLGIEWVFYNRSEKTSVYEEKKLKTGITEMYSSGTLHVDYSNYSNTAEEFSIYFIKYTCYSSIHNRWSKLGSGISPGC